ncbi:hypothetical protein DFH28DRAFT_1165648 [Melampsora americana]|nr:hypothetical protein DFH28DRAFT_1165648 [Melampsora americana]
MVGACAPTSVRLQAGTRPTTGDRGGLETASSPGPSRWAAGRTPRAAGRPTRSVDRLSNVRLNAATHAFDLCSIANTYPTDRFSFQPPPDFNTHAFMANPCSDQDIIPPYIVRHSDDPADPQFRCSACNSRTLMDFRGHIRTAAHHTAVQRLLDRQLADERMLIAIQSSTNDSVAGSPPNHFDGVDEEHREIPDPETPDPPLTPLTFLRQIAEEMADQSPAFDVDNHQLDFEGLRQALEALEGLNDDASNDLFQDAGEANDELEDLAEDESNGWYPFTRKEQLVALLIIGSTRSLLSRLQYQRIRSILRICKVNLPAWGSIRALSNRLKGKMGLNISERDSPAGNPLFGLQELANPIVSEHLVFLPEAPGNDPITRLSQSQKWRELYSRTLRVQMVVSKNTHYYIYEPVQVITGQLIVPVFFYKQDTEIMAKCLAALVNPASGVGFSIYIPEEPTFGSRDVLSINVKTFWRPFDSIQVDSVALKRNSGGVEQIPLINPWRIKAHGRIIRHVPLTLYSDDTSGNISKKFNKHMSIYFTLSGLPPQWSNQEYNTHFLATTNCASALELFDQVVDEINDLGRNGFTSYDHSLGEDVCTMVVVLCHLGDSPMHAEICNTTNPANTLTPCRICDLQVDRQLDKQSEEFVRHFLGLSGDGDKEPRPHRKWEVTRERTEEIWRAAQRRNSKKLVEDLGRQYGLRDTLNDYFIHLVWNAQETLTNEQVDILRQKIEEKWGDRIFNPMLRLDGFDGHLDTPVEILHVVLLGVVKYLFRDTMKTIKPGKAGAPKYNTISARWRSFNTKGLKVPPIQPTTLIQFFQSLVGKEFRTVLQTVPFVIYDYVTEDVRNLWTALCLLGSYVFQTEIHNVDTYLKELDAHVDLFLNQLISMSAQWVNKPKFHMLIHLKFSIRRFGPPSLVATEKFEAFNGKTRDASVHSNRQSPGNDVANTFLTALMLRTLLSGSAFYDHELQSRVVAGHKVRDLLMTIGELPQALGLDLQVGKSNSYADSGPKAFQAIVPVCLHEFAEAVNMHELASVTLPSGQSIEEGSFVVVASIWKPTNQDPANAILVLSKCVKGRIVPFYGMREYVVSEGSSLCSVKKVRSLVNLQHNCHGAECRVTEIQTKRLERRETNIPVPSIRHQPTRSFILNTASHYSAELHRELADIHVGEITRTQWHESIHKGLGVWTGALRPARKRANHVH